MKLWLARHAAVLVDQGVCYGSHDVEADDLLSRQSAQRLAAQLPQGTPVWVSPRARTRLLASHLHALRPDLPPARVDGRLGEMDFGQWEMRAWDGIPRSAIDAWVEDFPSHRFGGRESVQDVIDRVAGALHELGQPGSVAGADVLWVTHAGVIRAVQFLLAHPHQTLTSVAQWPRWAPRTGECFQVLLDSRWEGVAVPRDGKSTPR